MYPSPPFYSSTAFPNSPESFVSPSTPPVLDSSMAPAAYMHDTITKAQTLPASFYPEFMQYSKETYEQSTGLKTSGRKRKHDDRESQNDQDNNSTMASRSSPEDSDQGLDQPSPAKVIVASMSATSVEMRRQIHIQSEQKRRAQIKDGFEDLRNELPACLNKKMSKVALLHRTVQHIQHLKNTQVTIMAELERLAHENEQLRQFQQGVLQKHTLDNMYTINGL